VFTISLTEVENDKQYANDRAYTLVREYVDKCNYTTPSKRDVQKVQYFISLKSILDGWQQGSFTNEEYVNYLTSVGYLNLISKIRNV